MATNNITSLRAAATRLRNTAFQSGQAEYNSLVSDGDKQAYREALERAETNFARAVARIQNELARRPRVVRIGADTDSL